MSEVILDVKALRSGYGAHEVISNATMSVARGTVVAVVGPNGHGKTTLVRTISGLVKPRSGYIRFAGRDVSGDAPHAIARLGIAHAPQGDMLFTRMSIRDNLLMGAYQLSSLPEIRRRNDYVFALFPKLAERQTQLVSSLSGGERRMVGIGRALMSGARLLIIDEPSLGLAPLVIDQIYDAISELKEAGLSILLVEENPERASLIADDMYVIDDGKIVMSGPPQEILSKSSILDAYFGN